MRVFSLFSLLATAAFCYGQSATVVIGNIQQLTTMSSNLNTVVSNINVVNVLIQGPKVAQGLSAISNQVYQYINQMDNPPPVYGDVDAVAVVGVLKTFVKVHQTLLNTIIGKHGLLSLFFFTQPVRVALVSLEAAVDALALGLIDMIPTQAPEANGQFASLKITIDAAITVYS
ncbi:SubName: Full=Uncharacterized protein {ECO:0000313/EMBL:CCA72475.1} [Serendipita indica DSM 11827]|uniref:UVI-1 protein n=1 Tax=Serendipita indica (strain DSM 11827) TaxID=1109443 RepID=G4TMC7_SERID|nr:SubName: Full=Uncharacterized protein {ECO:0000313/EMBL:CCA72475.1} [Serendipita indica DSM 11827]CCA72475.1 hypothetical protein PIIN_06410 [Serendipita indica DSM 11827]